MRFYFSTLALLSSAVSLASAATVCNGYAEVSFGCSNFTYTVADPPRSSVQSLIQMSL